VTPLPTPEELAAQVALGCAFDTPAMRALLERAVRADREAIKAGINALPWGADSVPGGFDATVRVSDVLALLW
jgi:hypothetical protein